MRKSIFSVVVSSIVIFSFGMQNEQQSDYTEKNRKLREKIEQQYIQNPTLRDAFKKYNEDVVQLKNFYEQKNTEKRGKDIE